jgi:hypothetical protein
MSPPLLELLLLEAPLLDPPLLPLLLDPLLVLPPLEALPPLDALEPLDEALFVLPLLPPLPPLLCSSVFPNPPPPVEGLELQANIETASEAMPINRIVFMGALRGFLQRRRCDTLELPHGAKASVSTLHACVVQLACLPLGGVTPRGSAAILLTATQQAMTVRVCASKR